MIFRFFLVLALLASTLLASNSHGQTCELDGEIYSPETETLSQEEFRAEYESKLINGNYPKTAEEYQAASEERLNATDFDISEVLSSEEIASIAGSQTAGAVGEEIASITGAQAAEAAGELAGEAANFFLGIIFSIGPAIQVFKDPHSTDLDKASATLAWVPLVGGILFFADLAIHSVEKAKHIKEAGKYAEKLNYLQQYVDSVKEKQTLGQVKVGVESSFSVARNQVETEFEQELSDYYKKYYLLKAKSSVNYLGKYYASKWIGESKSIAELVTFLKKSFARENVRIPVVFSHESRVMCGMSDDHVFLNDKNTYEVSRCFQNIFNDYRRYLNYYVPPQATNSTDFDSATTVVYSLPEESGEGITKLINKYKKVRNHMLASIKLNAINKFYEVRKHTNPGACDIFKTHAQKFLDNIDNKMQDVARNSFWKDKKLDSQGRSLKSYCWHNSIKCSQRQEQHCSWGGGCSSASFSSGLACTRYYAARGAGQGVRVCYSIPDNWCQTGHSSNFCSSACVTTRNYDSNCGFVSWHPDRDDVLVQTKEELNETLTQEYNTCLTSYEGSHVDFSIELQKSASIVRETDNGKLFYELFDQVEIMVLETLVENFVQENARKKALKKAFSDSAYSAKRGVECLDRRKNIQNNAVVHNAVVQECNDNDKKSKKSKKSKKFKKLFKRSK